MATRTGNTRRRHRRSAPRLALFFGAGAEVAYGLPVGGRFALEAIRSSKGQVDNFKQARTIVHKHCDDAYRAWLPEVFVRKRIQTLTGTDQDRIFDDSLRTGYDRIIESLNNYDSTVKSFLAETGWTENRVSATFTTLTDGMQFGETPYQNIEIKGSISELPARLYKSKYFSAVIALAKVGPLATPMTEIARSTNQLYLGAHGQRAVLSLADQPLINAPEDNPAFQELGQMFSMHPIDAGVAAFKAVMNNAPDQELNENTIFLMIATMALEAAVERFLDYRSIVDELLPSLFRPRDRWGQFTKIFTFLMGTREFMLRSQQVALNKSNGYYHDLLSRSDCEINAIGTANYTSLAQNVLAGAYKDELIHLNGSLSEYLDPYKTEVVPAAAASGIYRFLAPFLFTQSGIKPLTSVEISRRYVRYYDSLVQCDAAVVVGFGFNADDGHINSLFRKALEETDLRLVILQYQPAGQFDASKALEELQRFLRLDAADHVTILPVTKSRKVQNRPWLDAVLDAL